MQKRSNFLKYVIKGFLFLKKLHHFLFFDFLTFNISDSYEVFFKAVEKCIPKFSMKGRLQFAKATGKTVPENLREIVETTPTFHGLI